MIVAPRQSAVAKLFGGDNHAAIRAIRTFIQIAASFHPDCRATKVLQDLSPDDVQAQLTAPGHMLAGISPEEVSRTISVLSDKTGMNAATAGALIQRYGYAVVHGEVGRLLQAVQGNNLSSVGLNDGGLSTEIAKIKDGTYDKVAAQSSARSQLAASITSAQQAYTTAQSDFLRLEQRAGTVPGSSALLTHAYQRLTAAQQLLKQATSRAQNPDGSVKEQYQRVNTPSAAAQIQSATGWDNQTQGGVAGPIISNAVAPTVPPNTDPNLYPIRYGG